MPQKRSLLLIREIERGWYNRSSTWEGKPEEVFDLGEVVVRTQPGTAFALCFRFPFPQIEERLDEIIHQIHHLVHPCWWVIGPNTQPLDLQERLRARGFITTRELQGLVLDNFSVWSTSNPEITVEPLSWENVEDYATLCSLPHNGVIPVRDQQLTYAHRYLQRSKKDIHIFVARLKGHVVGYALLRIQANGTADLCEAFTLPEARGQGVYLSLVGHRLAWAKERGCSLAVTRANTRTSAPILLKRGFKSVCRFVVLAHPSEPLVRTPV